MIGKVLKELYVDSALKRCNTIDQNAEREEPVYAESKPISWKQYKQINDHA
jgi:hypothetical protein